MQQNSDDRGQHEDAPQRSHADAFLREFLVLYDPSCDLRAALSSGSVLMAIMKKLSAEFPEALSIPTPFSDEERPRMAINHFLSTCLTFGVERSALFKPSLLLDSQSDLTPVYKLFSALLARVAFYRQARQSPTDSLQTESNARIGLLRTLITSQRDFLNNLDTLENVFLKDVMNRSEVFAAVGETIVQLRALNLRFLEAIIRCTGDPPQDLPIADAIQENLRPLLSASVKYRSNYRHVMASVRQAKKNDSDFRNSLAKSKASLARRSLVRFLMFPILQVSRHSNILRAILQQTTRTHADFRTLSRALSDVKEVELSFRLFDVQDHLTGMAPLLPDPQRQFIREGHLSVFTPLSGKRDLKVFLLSDIIVRLQYMILPPLNDSLSSKIFAKAQGAGKFKFKDGVFLEKESLCRELSHQDKLRDRAFQLVCSTRVLTLIAESPVDKASWKESVSLAILNRRVPDFSQTLQRLRDNDPALVSVELNACGMQSDELSEISAALAHNNSLMQLSLGSNQIDSEGICKFVSSGGLFNLTTVNLFGNPLRDRAITMLVEALSESDSIRSLDLSATGMTLLSIHPLCEMLASCPSLTHLALDRNKLGPEGIAELCEELKRNAGLTMLSLSDTDAGDVGAQHIAEALSSNETLTSLNLRKNGLSLAGCRAFAAILADASGLVELNLSRNDLGEGIKEIASALQCNNRLASLGIFVHHALDIGLTEISAALRHNESLTRLEYHASDSDTLRTALTWNHALVEIQGAAPALSKELALRPRRGKPLQVNTTSATLNLAYASLNPSFFSTLPIDHLVCLVLYENRLRLLPDDLFRLTALTRLVCRKNELSHINGIHRLANLTVLDVSANSLTTLPAEIEALTALSTLMLVSNRITALPREIYRLPKLAVIDLFNNPIRQDLGAVIVAAVGKQAHLSLAEMHLSTVAPELGLLTALLELDVSRNRLAALPVILASLCKLRVLNVSHNQLTSLPDAVAALPQLQRLLAASNRLSSLPRALSNLTTLTELDLSQNSFTALPDQVSALPSLRVLRFCQTLAAIPRLHSFRLSSQLQRLSLQAIGLVALPSRIAELKRLTSLCLRENQLQSLPAELFSLASLTELDLASNKLSSLPSALGQLTNLKLLSLRANSFAEIPPVIGRFALDSLDVGENPQLRTPPPAVIARGMQTTLAYLQDLQRGAEDLVHVNLVFAGPSQAGKTCLINALQGRAPTWQQEWSIDLHIERDGKKESRPASCAVVELPHADAAFFPVEHFSSDRTVFVLVFNVLTDQPDVVSAWLENLQSCRPDAVIVAVGTHIDQLKSSSEHDYRNRFTKVGARSASMAEELHFVSCTTGRGVSAVMADIKLLAAALPSVCERTPRCYVQLYRHILRDIAKLRPPVISYVELRDQAIAERTVANEQEFARALAYLHDTNFVVASCSESSFVVQSREWLWNTFAYLLPAWRSARHLPPLPLHDGLMPHHLKFAIWPATDFAERLWPVIIQLLREHQLTLAFGSHQDTSLVPPLLGLDSGNWEPTRPVMQRLYDFPNKLSLSFMMHLVSHISMEIAPAAIWRTGFVLAADNNRVRIDATQRRSTTSLFASTNARSNDSIVISARGPSPLKLLAIVAQHIDAVCNSRRVHYANATALCPHCLATQSRDPWAFSVAECAQAAAQHRHHMFCRHNPVLPVRIDQLIPEAAIQATLLSISPDDLIMQETLGATATKAQWHGLAVIVKNIDLASTSLMAEIRQELLNYSGVDHPNVVSLKGVVDSPSATSLKVVIEWMPYGCVRKLLRDPFSTPTPHRQLQQSFFKLAIDVAKGMQFLHSLTPCIIHKSIRTSCILVGTDKTLEGDGVVAKLDIGCIHVQHDPNDATFVPYWEAPELLAKTSQPSTKTDIYSFGIALWEILSGAVPFSAFEELAPYPDELQDAIIQGLRPAIPDRAPFDYARVIEDCWHKEAAKRPSADEVVRRLQAFSLRYSMHATLFKDDDSSSQSNRSADNTPRDETV